MRGRLGSHEDAEVDMDTLFASSGLSKGQRLAQLRAAMLPASSSMTSTTSSAADVEPDSPSKSTTSPAKAVKFDSSWGSSRG